MAEEIPKVECEWCEQLTDRPYEWRNRSFCSPECMNKAIEEVNQEIARRAEASPAAPIEPPPKPKKKARPS